MKLVQAVVVSKRTGSGKYLFPLNAASFTEVSDLDIYVGSGKAMTG